MWEDATRTFLTLILDSNGVAQSVAPKYVVKTPLCDTTMDACKNLIANASGDYVVVTTSKAGTLGTLYTLDQAGNIVAQMPDMGIKYSWAGNAYATYNGNSAAATVPDMPSAASGNAPEALQSQVVDSLQNISIQGVSLLRSVLDSSLTYDGFEGGNPSGTGVYIKKFLATIFVPYGIYFEPDCVWTDQSGTRLECSAVPPRGVPLDNARSSLINA